MERIKQSIEMLFSVSILIGTNQTVKKKKKKKLFKQSASEVKKKKVITEMMKTKNKAWFSFHINVVPKEQS